MPRIPVYEQRVTPSGSSQGGRISAGAAGASGAGLQAVGRGLQEIAGAMERKQEVDFLIEKDRIETEARVWVASASSKADLDQTEYLKNAQLSTQPGAPGFTPEYLKQYDQFADATIKNAPSQLARQMMQAHLARSREQFGRQALMFEAGERARYTGQQIDDGVQASAKLVYGDPSLFDAEMGKWSSTIRGAAIGEDGKAKLSNVARRVLVNSAVMSWIDRNPAGALTILREMSASGDLSANVEWVDGGRKYKVPVNMGTLEETLKWTEYADRKVSEIRQDMSVALRYETQNAEAMASAGVAPTTPARTREEFGVAFKDPQVADREYARYTTARQTATAVSTLQGRSSADLIAIMQRQPNAADPNFAITAGNQAIEARAAAEIVKARQADPVAYALQTGDFKLQPLNPSDPAAFAEELKRRTAALPGMAEKYGTASVLAKGEAGALAQQLELLPADKKVEQLEAMRTSIGDNAVYSSVLNSIRPDSPVTALVGNIAAAGNRENARLIAMGEDLLNPTKGGRKTDGKGATFPLPQEALLRQAWVDAVGDAYRGYPDAEATAYQAFKAYYAASAAQKGLNDPKASPDDKIVRSAIAASTGGIARWRTDWFGNETPSAKIVLPYGMAEDGFRELVAAEWLRVREAAGYPKTSVGDIGLFNTGANGEYMVMSGKSWLPDKEGRPVILRIAPVQREVRGKVTGGR